MNTQEPYNQEFTIEELHDAIKEKRSAVVRFDCFQINILRKAFGKVNNLIKYAPSHSALSLYHY